MICLHSSSKSVMCHNARQVQKMFMTLAKSKHSQHRQ